MESHALHLLPNTFFNNSYRCAQNKIWYSKCFPLPFRMAAKKYSFQKYMPAQHVLLTMRNESWNHRMQSRESSTHFRTSCFGSESGQNIIDNCFELNVEIVERCDVDIEKFKENVSGGNGRIVSQEEEIEKLSESATNGVLEGGLKFMDTSQSMWQQMKDVVMFAGPALGIWLCGPLLSLIDTAVIGQSSSLELAAMGPGTVVCDYLSYVFMFLSIATSNMVATSLAQKDEVAMQQQLSRLLFVALACGIGMLLLTKAFGTPALHAFVGSNNASLVPAASTYVQIRGLAWPAVLVGMVAQSASLGMKDSWGPLKVLSVASLVNGVGDILLCSFMGYGIAGAAWATTVSQFVAVLMMLQSVNKKGYNAFALSVPSSENLIQIIQIAAPVFITMISKVAFYSLITYFATSMGPEKLAAHQVMIGVYCMCTVWGEPLSQTAQAFMPALIHGMNRNLKKARSLLKSLLICGAITGFTLGCMGTAVSLFFPHIFTRDSAVIGQMHQVILPFFVGLIVTPPTHSLEGSLLAGRDLKFLSYTMSCNFCVCSLLLLIINNKGLGLQSCWWALACFQWARFSVAYKRLASFRGPLYDPEKVGNEHQKLKAI
ncbi:protein DETOXIFICATION 46, chloroplastic isoform X1 [Cryptomeria japonica]|nr:protein DETOXIFICATION 46, chloroplastic isoform X1 [Cryptomeria japonica]